MHFDHDHRLTVDYSVERESPSLSRAEQAAAAWTPGRLAHLYAVRLAVVPLAAEAMDAVPWRARRYWLAVVEATAMLHEAIAKGYAYEEVAARSNEDTALGVASLTPDFRSPPAARRQALANQVGLAPLHVQLVALVDASHSWQDDPQTAHAVLSCLHLVRRLRVADGIMGPVATAVGKACGKKVPVR